MSPQVKQAAIDYFESIGGIESVDSKYRYALKRRVIWLLTEIERNTSFEKMRGVYPMVGINKTKS